ncbi:MAG: hypothetical protein JAY75_23015 [Candidatus Thiodiazotropha taylori]|nr:hypothetical protein [Candidatus Thiodiazotropha taylori]MCW4226993.1 hypothetical protein [Candidatus Thiodiazotropha endolucinida]MCG7882932.1 hypothetical protein [Candidatus Thiodiazotropha taylori]MCG7888552.1 hypothetical protein [Candidatus Thiodiazotropha taylori]MCG7892254.1 hypothetical protein [Candidatus Thiodiazotropha taylori]
MTENRIAEIVAGLEDAGVFQNAADMRAVLAGTEHIRDDQPTIAYYWGWLECLETQQFLAAAA